MTDRLPQGFEASATLEVKRSRFLAVVSRTDDEPAMRALVATQRRLHPDARHHCSAFVLEGEGAQPYERSSDDGEPAGTAGAPMLEALRAEGLVNVTAVVTRWFGGIKLGTGGLARAYGDAVALALDGAPRVGIATYAAALLRADHGVAGRWHEDLLRFGAEVEATYGPDEVLLRLVHPDRAELASYVAALTSGEGVLVDDGVLMREVPRGPYFG